ncbi:helix-turn-helix transcriptional regulator [Stenotrophomonas sp.]|uniref:helix-turn-helix domain-containing protein n=1 Tax=Stenotrophomonas sp. TaxID=69392 RepID=UPI0031F320F7
MEPEVAFGKVLRALRRAVRMSQEELAFEADLQRNYISLLERGQNSPSIKTLFKLAPVLKSSPSEMLLLVEQLLNSRA